MTGYRRNTRLALALGAALLICGMAARADVVILKDGYTLFGVKTIREKEGMQTEEGVISVDRVGGMTVVDDGPRWTVFPVNNLQVADVSNTNKFSHLVPYKPKGDRYVGKQNLPPTANLPKISPWNDKEWTRKITFLDSEKSNVRHDVDQHIGVINPYYVRIGSGTHRLQSYFLLKEFGAERIRTFLQNHPDLDDRAKPDAAKRERFIRFWIQADWLAEADKDVAKFAKDFPAEAEKLAKLREELGLSRAEKLFAEVERAKDSGRHRAAMKGLAEFPKEFVPKDIDLKVLKLRAEYETRQGKYDAAMRHLTELPQLVSGEPNVFLKEAAAAVRAELHLDTMTRLEMFTTLADRAEQDAKRGRKATHTPEQLLASAVTGWHLGKVSAEAKVEAARKCWVARGMALAHFRNPNKRARLDDVDVYKKTADALSFDELEKLVSLLPPPDAPAEIPTGPTEVKLPKSFEFPKGAEFLLKLPDEYSPGRPYPLLILLPDGFERPEEMLRQFGETTSSHGYIVAVLKWYDPLVNKYLFGKPDHTLVMNFLRYMRRTYQVDSDRVFLLGNGEGGSMAMDVAAGHPTTFAGVSAFNPLLLGWLFNQDQYWMNFQTLPTYIVMGDRAGRAAPMRPVLEKWMPKGYPALVITYKGRGAEWFPEELPFLFDWMGRKKRADPGKQLGPTGETAFQNGFRTVRSGDDRFHWVTLDEIHPACLVNYENGLTGYVVPKEPAKIFGKITEGNNLQLSPRGIKTMTVWFGQGMFDYTKPVTVKVGEKKPVTKVVTPNLNVLMEDLYDRADRQRPYFEKMELKIQN